MLQIIFFFMLRHAPFRRLCRLFGDAVADAAHRFNQAAHRAELLAQRADMHVHRASFAAVVVVPDLREDLVARQHDAAVLEQVAEQLELLVGQRNLAALHRHVTALDIDKQRVGRIVLFVALLCGAAQQCLHARDKLHHAEGLWDVVVRAAVQPHDAVVFGAFRRQHNHGQIGRFRVAAQAL